MNLILRMSRLFVAMTLLAGPSGPVYAGSMRAPSSPDKGGAAFKLSGEKPAARNAHAPASASPFNVPLYFEANRGQTDPSVKFFARAAGYNLYLTSSEAVMVMPKAAGAKGRESDVVRMKLKGANASPAVQGRDILPGKTSYFFGKDPSKWQVGVEQYAKVRYGQVYPGIDMVYYVSQGHVEHDFVVAPGANPGRILLGFEGGKDLRLDSRGNLIVGVEGGELIYKAPSLYQMRNGARNPVKGRFALAGKKQVRFVVGDYMRNKELVIDPQIVYSTYLGGSVDDKINGIALDATKQAYVTGYSRSAVSGAGGFPAATNTTTYTGVYTTNRGGSDVFVAKLSANGASLMWLAWMGSTWDEQGNAIGLDKSSPSTPRVFITGATSSPNFPTAGPAMQVCTGLPGSAITSLAFVAELTQTGNIPALVYSTCWGGNTAPGKNSGNAIAVDSVGAAYVTGTTFATDFPITPALSVLAPYNTMGTASESAFVLKIAPLGVSVVYSMLLGPGDTITRGNAIAVDAGFQAWVTGQTMSSTLPEVTHHFASSKVGASDAYVVKVKADGTGLLYATYINGNTDEVGTAIALNNGGLAPYNVFVAGWTNSTTDFPSTAYFNLPTSVRPVVYQKVLTGAEDPFVIRLNPFETPAAGVSDTPLEMVYATHIGATGFDRAAALALDSRDDAYIAGWTVSSDWPVVANDTLTPGANGINVTGAVQSNTSGGQDAFVAAIGPDGQTRPFFTYLGAAAPPQAATGIIIDADHNIYVAGFTASHLFPLVTGSLMDGSVATKQINGTGTENAFDGFVTKIAPVVAFGAPIPPAASVCTISAINPGSGFTLGGTTVTISGTGFNVAQSTVQFDGVDASSFTVYATSTTITAVAPRHPLTGALVAGLVPLTVTTPAGTCTINSAYTTGGSLCTISGITPSSGFTLGGTTVTITGAGFNGLSLPSHITFDGVNASSYTVNNTSTVITAIAPRHPLTGLPLVAGAVSLAVVTTTSGTCTTTYDYIAETPGLCTISSISPTSGFTLGGTVVTVTGTNFYGFSGPNAVAFDGVAASTYTVNTSSTVIIATAPRHPLTGALVTGLVPFRVTTSVGTCSTNYTYLFAPATSTGVCGDQFFFPSPATGATGTFAYCMEGAGTARVRVYNVIGDIVARLEDAKAMGPQLSTLNTARLAPGVYLYILERDYGDGNVVRSPVKKFVVKH